VVENFYPLHVFSPACHPVCFFFPLPFKITTKGAILPTLRNTVLEHALLPIRPKCQHIHIHMSLLDLQSRENCGVYGCWHANFWAFHYDLALDIIVQVYLFHLSNNGCQSTPWVAERGKSFWNVKFDIFR